MKILQSLTVLILVLFPFGEILRFDLGNYISLKLVEGTVILLSIAGLWYIFHNIDQIKKVPFIKQITLFTIIACFSLLINIWWLKQNEFFTSLLYLIRWISYAVLYIIAYNFVPQFKKIILYIMLLDGLIILTAGYVQFFLYPSLHNLIYLGWDNHLYRMFSVFLDPNFAGAFFVLYFMLVLGFVYSFFKQKRMKYVLVLICILFFTFFAVLLTYSRGALLMLVASVFTLLILFNKKRFILLFLAVILIYFIIISPKFYIENINPFRIRSTMARILSWKESMRIIQDHYLFGVGFDTYRYAQIKYGIRKETLQFPSHSDAGADNSFLFVFATTGIFGLTAYIAMWVTILKRSYVLFKNKRSINAAVIFSSIIGLCMNSMFINSLFYPACMLWMWLLLSVMENTLF